LHPPMALIHIDHHPSPRQLRLFGIVWLAFFAAAGGILLSRGCSVQIVSLVFGVAAAVPAVGWFLPPLMRFIYLGMAYATFPLGFLISFLVLVIIYYFVLTPTGLAMRLFGYDPMNRRFDRDSSTYWCPRECRNSIDRYFKQF